MKKNRMQISTLLTLLLCMLLLTACGASAAESEGTDPETPPQESAAAPETEEPSAQQEDVTLEELLGEDYVNYLTETITMRWPTAWTRTRRSATSRLRTTRR